MEYLLDFTRRTPPVYALQFVKSPLAEPRLAAEFGVCYSLELQLERVIKSELKWLT